MIKLTALLVTHNRRDTTLRALRRLAQQSAHVNVQIVLLDDGSVDGTIAAVRTEFPETHVLVGDGSMFWNRGLYHAWSKALSLPTDGYLWLNDDVLLDDTALDQIWSGWEAAAKTDPTKQFILVGSTQSPGGEYTYGGKNIDDSLFSFKLLSAPPNGTLQRVQTFNGNVVVVPRQVVDRIGINDPYFYHNMGDIDYGLRAHKAGVAIYVLPTFIGMCRSNLPKVQSGYGSPSLSTLQQWKRVAQHHGLPPRSWWRLTRRHSGARFIFHFLLPYRHLFIPRIGLRKVQSPATREHN